MFNSNFLSNNPSVLIMISVMVLVFFFYTIGRIVQKKFKFTLGNNFFAIAIGTVIYLFASFL
jgi:hypothetical protein